jgi:hypothetical protein
MSQSRREFGCLFALAAAAKGAAADPVLPSHVYSYDGLPVRTRGLNAVRPIFNGELHSGFAVEYARVGTGARPGTASSAPSHS